MKFDYDDDFITRLIFEIERIIFDYDDAARSRDIRLTDSNVKSALSKVKKSLKGGSPKFPDSKEKERAMAFMGKAIIQMIELNIDSEDELNGMPTSGEWLRAISKIEDSIKLRQVSGGREYLNFLEEFIPDVIEGAKRDANREQQISFNSETPHCGICGETENLTKTECCDNWICDDEDEYVMFSYARNSCKRNHRRFTLCGLHYAEGHSGDWKGCEKCKTHLKDDPEMYVYYGTNEYNFEVLDNPPAFEKQRCSICSKIINRGSEGYSVNPGNKLVCTYCNDLTLDIPQGE